MSAYKIMTSVPGATRGQPWAPMIRPPGVLRSGAWSRPTKWGQTRTPGGRIMARGRARPSNLLKVSLDQPKFTAEIPRQFTKRLTRPTKIYG